MKNFTRILCFVLLSVLGLASCASGGTPSSSPSSAADETGKTAGSGRETPQASTSAESSSATPPSSEPTPPETETTARASSPSPAPTPTPTETPEEEEEEIDPLSVPESVTVGKVRVQLLSDSLIRIEAAGASGFEDRPSFTVPTRTGWKKIGYELSEENGKTVVSTEKYKVYIPANAARFTDISVSDSAGKELWRFETMTDSNVYLPSPGDSLDSWYFCDSPRVIPSENGYSLPGNGEYEKNNGWETDRNAKDLFLFLPGGSYKTFTKDYVKLTGRTEMIPLDLLGYWDSRWYAYSEETALKQIRDYKEKGYSIDVLVIDTDWRVTSGGVGYKINEKLFPDMAGFLEKAHEEGVTIIFNDHPEPVSGTTGLLDKKEIDYRSKNLKLILALGLDYWWYDRNWSVALKPIADGLSIYTTGMYAFKWITDEYYQSIANELETYARRGIIMANVDGINNGVVSYAPEIASHRYALQWTGDIDTDAYALDQEINDLIFAGAELGLPYVSSDLGGHTSEVTKDMYVRWIQYGALSNICRVHCTKPYSRMPWLYGETAEAVAKEYVGMRYRLLPLFYALAHENYTTGLPVMRRLDINYPQYVESSANDEYLLGDYVLVAPVSGAGKVEPLPDAMLTHDGQPGLYAEYFKNNSLKGEPDLVRVDPNIDFDWSNTGSKELGIAENFSIRWTGEIDPGDSDIMLRFYADDGVRVWIDGKLAINGWSVYDQYLFTKKIAGGKKHSIKVEYCQKGGYAHIFMTYTTRFDDARTVFLPDGEWIDVWTGERTVGPATVRVDHPLETSPIYVRSGAIVALADNMTNTKEKNWEVMALDVYPSKNFTASTVIYEDDCETVAYKDGKFRTTKVKMSYTDALTLDIDAAKGEFDSEFRAFEERTFRIRVHARSDFGAVGKITLNGEPIDAQFYEIAPDASPFAFSGGARDGAVCEIVFKTNVRNANQIKVFFESPVDDRVAEQYDKTPVSFSVKVEKINKSALTLSEGADLDWALFGNGSAGATVRMKDGSGLIGQPASDGKIEIFNNNYPISWSGGDTVESGKTTYGPLSRRNFRFTLKTTGEKTVYTLFVGGWKSAAKITVRDRAGNVQTLTFGDMNTNYYRKVVIVCESGDASELSVNYSILSGENITFSAAQASSGR